MDGEQGLTLTGQLGDVMKESAQIALSYVRAHATELGVDPAALNKRVHLHVPAGAVPKDGPSAGVAMFTAIASLFSDRPVRTAHGLGRIGFQVPAVDVAGAALLDNEDAGFLRLPEPGAQARLGDRPVAFHRTLLAVNQVVVTAPALRADIANACSSFDHLGRSGEQRRGTVRPHLFNH